jgi:hypothetical protein
MTWIIHCSQGLTFDFLTFDLTSVTKHGLTYITLLGVHSKEHLHSLSPLLNKKCQVDHFVPNEMFQLRINAQYKLELLFF